MNSTPTDVARRVHIDPVEFMGARQRGDSRSRLHHNVVTIMTEKLRPLPARKRIPHCDHLNRCSRAVLTSGRPAATSVKVASRTNR